MSNINNNDELVLDFKKLCKTFQYRKNIIVYCFLIIISLTLLITFFMPKKYESETKLLINKSSSTNLANINPFILSEMADMDGGMSGLLKGSSDLENEIEIIKSPLVLDEVVKANHIVYKNGKKKGEFLSVDDFLKKNISIENLKGTNVISIKYKSKDPILTYNVLSSIIKNYKEAYEEINSKKAFNDKKLIYKSYIEAKADLDNKIEKLKQTKNAELSDTSGTNTISFSLLGFHDKEIGQKLNQMSIDAVNTRKLEEEVNQAAEKLKRLNEKLEWTSLVGNLSKEISKITILKEPEHLRNFENTEPSLILNILLSIAVSIILSIFAVILFEKKDKRLAIIETNEKTLLVSSNDLTDIIEDIVFLSKLKNTAKTTLISLTDDNNIKIPENFNISYSKDSIDEHVKNLQNSDKFILVSQIGITDKILYKKIQKLILETEKEFIAEYSIV
ncbi:MAG: Wzz/FepE/Etk N-terminal domain-containing protein [bacterium]